MNSLIKLLLFVIFGIFLLTLAVVFLPFILLFAVIRLLAGKPVFIYNRQAFFNRSGRPQADPEGAGSSASAVPHVPASEDVIDAEIIELPDEETKRIDT